MSDSLHAIEEKFKAKGVVHVQKILYFPKRVCLFVWTFIQLKWLAFTFQAQYPTLWMLWPVSELFPSVWGISMSWSPLRVNPCKVSQEYPVLSPERTWWKGKSEQDLIKIFVGLEELLTFRLIFLIIGSCFFACLYRSVNGHLPYHVCLCVRAWISNSSSTILDANAVQTRPSENFLNCILNFRKV